MERINNLDMIIIEKLFNSGGYVLDFSTSRFDEFTNDSIGIPLCEKYQMSKWQSLKAFIQNEEMKLVLKLLNDLIEYYEINFIFNEKNKYDKKNKPLLDKLKINLSKYHLTGLSSPIEQSIDEIMGMFDSEYIKNQIDLMKNLVEENPTESIGKSKELLESCIKTILDRTATEYDDKWDLPKLAKITYETLGISKDKISDLHKKKSQKDVEIMKQIIGSLTSIVFGLAELRNNYGSGHGKSANFKGLKPKHANLAVGASVSIVSYLWTSYTEKYL